MENFVVSARKYRPATFDSVVGQEHITNTLKNAIRNNHLAQAFLFCGPRGVGKTTCARILAKTINCQNPSADTEPCNECESCLSFNEAANFNIYELDAASNNSVDDIRGLVEQVRYAPQGAKFKVYIIDEVHMLSSAAFNAFLKTLEEPPSYAIFILATTERHKILPTILSRCQVFDFKRIRIGDITSQLGRISEREGITAEPEALHMIAQKADGALRDALSIFDQMVSFSGNNLTYSHVIQNLNILDYEYYFRLTDAFSNRDITSALLIFDEIINNGFEVSMFLSGLSEHFRNLIVCRDESTLKLMEVAESVAVKYRSHAAQCSPSFLLNALNIVNQFEIGLKGSRNQRLHIELCLMKICHILSVIEPGVETGDKKKTEHLSASVTPPLPPPPPTTAPTSKPAAAAEAPKQIAVTRIGSLKNIKPAEEAAPLVPDPVSPPLVNEPAPETGNPRSEVTQDSLNAACNRFAQNQLDKGRKSLYTYFKSHPPVLDQETVVFSVSSKLEAGHLEEIRLEMMDFLKTELSNVYLRYELKFEKLAQVESVPYTDTEIFKAMVADNPAIGELRNYLDLDFK